MQEVEQYANRDQNIDGSGIQQSRNCFCTRDLQHIDFLATLRVGDSIEQVRRAHDWCVEDSRQMIPEELPKCSHI